MAITKKPRNCLIKLFKKQYFIWFGWHDKVSTHRVCVCMRVEITKEKMKMKNEPIWRKHTNCKLVETRVFVGWMSFNEHRSFWKSLACWFDIILWFEVRSSRSNPNPNSSYNFNKVHSRTLLELNHSPNMVAFPNSHKSRCFSLFSSHIRKK